MASIWKGSLALGLVNIPIQLESRYDSGDYLHPGDAGYLAMGNAIDLPLFRRR